MGALGGFKDSLAQPTLAETSGNLGRLPTKALNFSNSNAQTRTLQRVE